MKRIELRALSYGFLVVLSLFFMTACSSHKKDDLSSNLSASIVYLGNPYSIIYPNGEAIYSRNIWDMQLFDEKIFLGAGNSSNQGSSQNSGPLPVMAYDIKRGQFVQEEMIRDEQIDLYKIIDGTLYIPGHDATGSWEWGNFYQRNNEGRWVMYRNVPKALHLYDLVSKENKLFAAIGLYEGAAVGITEDMGKHWKIFPLGRSRVYSFLPVDDTLFALKKFKRTDETYFSVAQYLHDGTFSARFDISIYKMFPQTVLKQVYAKAVHILPLKEKTLYIGAYKYNDHQSLPFGLYVASLDHNKFQSKRVKLDPNFIPRDILLHDDKVNLLVEDKQKNGTIIRVLESSVENLLEWKELFYFKYPTFARSFERVDNTFYFGMGCDIDPQHWNVGQMPTQTGDIIKIVYKES